MNNKQKKTLKKIFTKPSPTDIKWQDIISLFKALEIEIQISASGSRVGVIFKNVRMVLHKPHPGNEIKKYVVADIKDFLERIGVTP